MSKPIGILAEKKSQAEALAKGMALNPGDGGFHGVYQGREYRITFARGHLVELESPDSANPSAVWHDPSSLLPLPTNPRRVAAKDARKDIAFAKKGLKGVGEIIIATDPDREGEAIGRDLVELLGFSVPMRRLWLTAGLDENSIRSAMANLKPMSESDGLFWAQRSRSHADWLYTYVTMAYSAIGRAGLLGGNLGMGQGKESVVSVGRVQTPTLRMIVERDLEIANFVPVEHFKIALDLSQGGETGTFTYQPSLTEAQSEILLADPRSGFVADEKSGHLLLVDRSRAQAFLDSLNVTPGRITLMVEKEESTKQPPKPFAQIDLQRAANRKLGFSAQKTLEIASELYLAGHVSYPGTDRDMLPSSEFDQAWFVLSGLESVRGIETGGMTLSELADSLDALPSCYEDNPGEHHAIMPTLDIPAPGSLSQDQEAVYTLIAERFIQAHFPPAVIEKQKATATFKGILGPAGEDSPVAMVSGSCVVDPGWLAAFPGEDARSEIPPFKDGKADFAGGRIDDKKTSPPDHYTEDTLLADMKNAAKFVPDAEDKAILKRVKGLGTARTRGEIIAKLVNRAYIRFEKKRIRASQKGIDLIAQLEEDLSSVSLTAIWESRLDAIEVGGAQTGEVLCHSFITDQVARLEHHLSIAADRLRSGMDSGAVRTRAPSPKALSFATNIAETLGIQLPDSAASDMTVCRAFIDSHADAARAQWESQPKPPSEKALAFATSIAERLSIELPEQAVLSAKACSEFINANKSKKASATA